MITTIIMSLFGRWIADAEGQIKEQWRWIVATPVHALATLLAVSIALNLWLWRREAQCASQVAQITAAQKRATVAQIQVNQAPAIASAQIASQSDAQAPAYYAAVSAAAAAHDRIVQPGACPSGAASVPGPDPVAPVDDRPGAGAVMVSRPKADDDQIVAAAARGVQCHADAMTLIAVGAAVADDAP